MNYQYIEQLIERYFAAETSAAEEDILRAFFGQSDVPRHLLRYAPLFAYEASARREAPLGHDFDRRVLDRLEAMGDAPELRVKVKRMTFGERIRPLWRAAAAVAIVVVLVGGARESIVRTTHTTIITGGDEAAHAEQVEMPQPETPYRQVQEGMKMAVTTDSAHTVLEK